MEVSLVAEGSFSRDLLDPCDGRPSLELDSALPLLLSPALIHILVSLHLTNLTFLIILFLPLLPPLPPQPVFIIDNGKELYVWIGGSTSSNEKKNAMSYAHNYLMETKHPLIPVTCVGQGKEPSVFDKLFS